MMNYAVMIEVDFGQPDYVRDGNPWTNSSPVKIFSTREEAQVEAAKWNTGQVVVWKILDDWDNWTDGDIV